MRLGSATFEMGYVCKHKIRVSNTYFLQTSALIAFICFSVKTGFVGQLIAGNCRQ